MPAKPEHISHPFRGDFHKILVIFEDGSRQLVESEELGGKLADIEAEERIILLEHNDRLIDASEDEEKEVRTDYQEKLAGIQKARTEVEYEVKAIAVEQAKGGS